MAHRTLGWDMLLFKGGVSKNISIDNILIFLGHADIGDYASYIAANAPLVFTDPKAAVTLAGISTPV